MTMILIIAFPMTPGTTDLDSYRNLLKTAIQNLLYWRVVPFMQSPLREMGRIARSKGILTIS